MQKKIICLILCFFLIITTFLSSNVKAFEVTVDENHFNFFCGDSYYHLRNFPSYYNPDTDYFFILNDKSSSWEGHGSRDRLTAIVFDDLKTKIDETNGVLSCTNDNFFEFFYCYDDGTKIIREPIGFWWCQYNTTDDCWECYCGFGYAKKSDIIYDTAGLFFYAPIPIYNKDNLNTELYHKSGYIGDDLPYIANSIQQLKNVSVGELAIVPYDVASSSINVTMHNNTTDELVFSVNLFSDFENVDQYVQRIDIDDPFSELAYCIPFNLFPEFQFVEGNEYTILLNFSNNVNSTSVTFTVNKTIKNIDIVPTPKPTPDPNQGLIDSNKETQNILNDQTNAIKENTETNKNIFQKIGDILSFINPFSENFFGRKLVELIIDGIKSLFIPEDDFFSNYFDEIKQWFSDRLGFLWAPFDLLIELLNRMLSINFSEPKFSIPDINEPFTNNKIISAQEFNFNDLLENNVIKTVHDIYLILVDAFIVFNLYKLAQEKLEEVFTK